MLEVKTYLPKHKLEREFALRGLAVDAATEQDAAESIEAVRDGRAAPGEKIPAAALDAARDGVSAEFRAALSIARVNLRRFHESRRRAGSVREDGGTLRVTRSVRPLRRVGVVCGGSFMSLLLHAVPAQVAGVGEIAVAAAPGADGAVDPRVLAAARCLGLEEVYALSGAEAVAAMTFGAAPLLRRVDKIVGSDGMRAVAAKRRLAHLVGTDGDAGRGELVVIADGGANAKCIAADLLAQAECGACGAGGLLMLLTDDRMLAEAVRIELGRLAGALPDGERLLAVLDACGGLYLLPGLDAAVDAANILAPARLSLQTGDDGRYLPDIETAGAVFLGAWAAETAGFNSFLPAFGTARFASGLGVDAFTREAAVVECVPGRLAATGRLLAGLAEEEGRPARAAAVRGRMEILQLTAS